MTARNFVRTLLAISVAAYSFPAAALTELTDATQVSVGTGFACVVTTAGGVKCWGNNVEGELGDGTTANDRTFAGDVVGLTSGVARVEAGDFSACALMQSGVVKCWGSGANGQF